MQADHHDPATMALMQRIEAQLAGITFDKDDAASIRAGIFAARHVFEAEVWPYRDNGPVVTACREMWDALLAAILVYRHRARMPDAEFKWLCQWEPMPGQNYDEVAHA